MRYRVTVVGEIRDNKQLITTTQWPLDREGRVIAEKEVRKTEREIPEEERQR